MTQLDPIYVDLNQPVTTLLRLQQELAAGELENAGDGAAKVSLKLEDGSTYPLAGRCSSPRSPWMRGPAPC